jgi:hypothetical protein
MDLGGHTEHGDVASTMSLWSGTHCEVLGSRNASGGETNVDDPMAIGGVSVSLQRLLADRMELPPGLDRSSFKVTIGPPHPVGSDERGVGSVEPRVNIFLYRVTENPTLRNVPSRGDAKGGPAKRSLELELHYLVTAFGTTYAHRTHDSTVSHYLMGSALQVLHGNPVISRKTRASDGSPILHPSLKGESEPLKIQLESGPSDEMFDLFSSMSVPYTLSVTIRVTPVRIEEDGRPGASEGKAPVDDIDSMEGLKLKLDRIHPKSSWDDMKVPRVTKSGLRELVRYHQDVSKGPKGRAPKGKRPSRKGTFAHFCGPDEEGRTLAARVIATELGHDLYRIDLASVVSKYIGETEKNLSALFRTAEEASAVLLLDEADELFGKRTGVKDGHDRYANIEINYLLQKMEDYKGLCILATNMRNALDPAFMRRLRYTIEFPMEADTDVERTDGSGG